MTSTKRIEALQEFGYSPRDATFLCLAALHSGFFLRRQYRLFAGINPGRADDNFINKLYYHGHVRVIAGKANLRIYHLSSHPFYRAIGEGDNRHRRMRPLCSIKAKLMALDYVLAHPEESFLATEEEKVEYFTRRLGIDAACLPTKTYHAKTEKPATRRFFVDKFPIALHPETAFSPLWFPSAISTGARSPRPHSRTGCASTAGFLPRSSASA